MDGISLPLPLWSNTSLPWYTLTTNRLAVSLPSSMSSLFGGRSQLHTLWQLLWWKSDRVLAVSHREGVDSIVELSLKVDRERHSVEIKKWYGLSLSMI